MFKRYFFHFLLFLFVVLVHIYFNMNIFLVSNLNIILIFLIFTLFYFPLFYLFFLILLSALILDSLSGLFWGLNLILLLSSLGIGMVLSQYLEKFYFLPRLIIGQIVITLYFLELLIINLILKTSNISLIVFEQFLITSIFYFLLSFLFSKIASK